MNYKKELDKVISHTVCFVYRGVLVQPMIGGFYLLNQHCKKEEIDGVIDAAMDKLSKSLTKQSETG